MRAVGGALGPGSCPVEGPRPIEADVNSARAVGGNTHTCSGSGELLFRMRGPTDIYQGWVQCEIALGWAVTSDVHMHTCVRQSRKRASATAKQSSRQW